METKICSNCGKEKLVEEFGKYFDNRDGKHYYNSKCKICLKEYQKQWYEDNKEWCKEYCKNNKESIAKVEKLYRENHKEHYNEYMKRWYKDNKDRYKQRYQDNKEYIKERHKQYRKNNKSKINVLTAKRRSAKRNQIPTNADKEKISYIYQIAHEMTEERGVKYHVDHIKPLSKGGLHHEDNLQILSKGLNLKKANKWPLTKEEKLLYIGITIKDLKKGDI